MIIDLEELAADACCTVDELVIDWADKYPVPQSPASKNDLVGTHRLSAAAVRAVRKLMKTRSSQNRYIHSVLLAWAEWHLIDRDEARRAAKVLLPPEKDGGAFPF